MSVVIHARHFKDLLLCSGRTLGVITLYPFYITNIVLTGQVMLAVDKGIYSDRCSKTLKLIILVAPVCLEQMLQMKASEL